MCVCVSPAGVKSPVIDASVVTSLFSMYSIAFSMHVMLKRFCSLPNLCFDHASTFLLLLNLNVRMVLVDLRLETINCKVVACQSFDCTCSYRVRLSWPLSGAHMTPEQWKSIRSTPPWLSIL